MWKSTVENAISDHFNLVSTKNFHFSSWHRTRQSLKWMDISFFPFVLPKIFFILIANALKFLLKKSAANSDVADESCAIASPRTFIYWKQRFFSVFFIFIENFSSRAQNHWHYIKVETFSRWLKKKFVQFDPFLTPNGPKQKVLFFRNTLYI